MATTLTESTTNEHAVAPGREYAFGVAGTWDGMTVTIKWTDNTTNVAFSDGSFTADGGIVFIPPTGKIQVVSGADSSNAGSVIYNIYETGGTGVNIA